ncbi:LOW QUALITY PROTEIN: protein dachsous-like [Centruroides vittatus]|uniref:LOW QUALITY PROTEIN: protein dachsous-like n=1 Tax=Centruroides vittatus TaxID=120091 RepID=UPI00350F80CF
MEGVRRWRWTVIFCLLYHLALAEYLQEFEISEGLGTGTTIGYIGHSKQGLPKPPPPPYLIVPVPGSAVDSDLHIDQSTGEIRTNIILDREVRSYYSFVAIPLSGENVRVVIKVRDENDNAPEFPTPYMSIEFPENTPRDMKRTLNPARDRDLGVFNTQRYEIISGNVNNAFRLSSHRERDDVLYLDLQINGFLDRETIPFYSIVIEAYDGGMPPLKGSMTVNITIQDVNDNQPIFNQSRYFATVAENATVGTSVLRVFATDTDSTENGRITYSINRRQSDRENKFAIDPVRGVISINKPLDFESRDVHELVVVARDNGAQPLETTAFVSVRVTDVNDNQPTINLIFLSDDASPKISEDARPGEFVARISVNDPDSKEEYANVNVTLQGGDGHFGLTTQDNIIYLVIVSHPLDREVKPNYTMVVTATDQGNPPLNTSRTFELSVTDTNDNAPEFDQTVYYANVLEVADPGTSVFQLSALDRDEGNNSVITYSIKDTPETHSQWFQIDSRTGLITTRTHIDCETDPIPQITVVAKDAGPTPLSSSATVVVTISDVNDNEPIFDQTFYNATVLESDKIGTCFLKVSATDPDCGVNAMVNYTMGGGKRSVFSRDFTVQPVSGDLCIARALDHEIRNSYEIPIIATDRGGLSTIAMIKVQIMDVNDNRPVFYPQEYNVSLHEGNSALSSPVVVVAATDADSGIFGQITYDIVDGNEQRIFRIDRNTGEIFVIRTLNSNPILHHLTVSAKDGGKLASEIMAHVYVSVISSNQQPPIFEQSRYSFSVREDAAPQMIVGTVVATTTDSRAGMVRYAIYSGDPESYFSIDPLRGNIISKDRLDHEKHPFLLLNIQATSGHPPTYGHTQVNITIWDVNDNAPHFDSMSLKISVPENAELDSPIYVAHAEDLDSNKNGEVHYQLVDNPDGAFSIGETSGTITLRNPLDYEVRKHYVLILSATDSGLPPLSSNMTLIVEVQDVNDNVPIFAKSQYKVNVLESLPANSQFLEVVASDKDTGNNARLTYKLANIKDTEKFGIFPNSGFLYLKEALDRETIDHYSLIILAVDNGNPSLSATTTVLLQVLDANDNDPQFVEKKFVFTVEENGDKGLHVGTLSAKDKDLGNNASLRYTLLNTNGSFQINPITGEIYTKTMLDREIKSKYELTAEVRDQGTPSRFDQAAVEIQVLDVNDNAPVFIEPVENIIEVLEEQPEGTEVVQVLASDLDEGKNAAITFEIIPGKDETDGSHIFSIHKTTGKITTNKLLDHEKQQIFSLSIVAKDGGVPSHQSQLHLQIQVLDLNDNQPIFSTSSLTFRIREQVPVGHEIGRVHAIDVDGGENGRVLYSIVGGNLYGVFNIGRTTGLLYTVGEVDYEQSSEYMLQIKAIDNSATNPHSSVINVKIEIEDINDCIPTFKNDPILFSIPESTPQGTPVWNFSAIDRDSGINGQVRYAISQQSPKAVFKIDSKIGMLTLTEDLDYEEFSEYTIIISATDQAKNANKRLASSATCKIIIEDENDNSPVFQSRSRIDILEDEPVGFPLLHIIAGDKDSRDNGRVTYVITRGNENGHFSVEYETGLLTVAKPLDREEISHYVLNITASDHGRPPRSAYQLLHIYIEDINDNPPHFLQQLYKANISENSPVGTFVIKVDAIDHDLGDNGNLRYMIPLGVADNKFTINSETGEIYTAVSLDREERASYFITVYVHDGAFPTQYDITTYVDLLDVNDHAPEFGDSCYALHVPENSDLSVIHTLLATDHDAGLNAEVTYTITEGNIGNKFNIDLRTGQLSSRPLDREQVSHYNLVITARDHGNPSLSKMCNISIIVLDQNDNDPQFEHSEYSATVPEDIALNSSVLVVQAHDQDDGINSKVTYSLSNETQSLFWIDSETGIITTAGHFDREKKATYMFEVRATDGGKYDARSERALIHITVMDVNDNRPIFSKYPFMANVSAHAASGTQVLQLHADDKDEGHNAEVIYSFASPVLEGRFHLDSKTGIVTVASSLLADAGHIFHTEIIARDRGQPPKTATGVLQIYVGEGNVISTLKFQNSTYIIQLPENSPVGTEVIQVKLNHSPSSNIIFSFSSGNEDSALDINSRTGLITVRDSYQLDHEKTSQLHMLVVAQTEDTVPIYGYATLFIRLLDQNDNAPSFSQERYVSSVWEGNNKGTFVTQVTATDNDMGGVGIIIYHIIDGNHDNAFIIDPPFSGIVKTNIVLDREIRDAYRLTIIATDDGSPQLTGTCTLRISIIDVNDNQPVFPPNNMVSISEGSEVGTVITTITANDVDTNPALIYSFSEGGNPNNMFSIDRFSGRITLAQPLDHEKQNKYHLQIQASDSAHIAETYLTVHVTDVNDNPPVFSQQSYEVELPKVVEQGHTVISVNATDFDSEENGRIHYSLGLNNIDGFCIEETTGKIYTNKSLTFNSDQPVIQLVVTAQDSGQPPWLAVASVHIQITDINKNAPKFSNHVYTAHISEDSSKGSTVLKMSASDPDESSFGHNIDFVIISGNTDSTFSVAGNSGEIILMKKLDREETASYTLKVIAMDRGTPSLNSSADVYIYVDDVNDNPPQFNQSKYEASVSELAAVGTRVLRVTANDRDEGQFSQIVYDITSGNDDDKFFLNAQSGDISIKELLDYDSIPEYRFIIRATDNDPLRPLSALTSVVLKILDENDNSPHFPLTSYKEVVEENAPVGSSVFVARAIDGDRGIYGKLNYSVMDGDGRDKFVIDPVTGIVTTMIVFDYESKNKYFFNLLAMDAGGKYASVQVQVDIESKDEYPPEFSQSSYHFTVPGDAPTGYVVGSVHAIDRDEGVDGRIIYQLRNIQTNFAINSTTGIIIVKSAFHYDMFKQHHRDANNHEVSLVVLASSGHPSSLSSHVVIEIIIDFSLNSTRLGAPEERVGASLPAWGLGVVIALAILAIVLLTMIVVLRMRTKRNAKPAVVQGFVSSFDSIDLHHPPSSSASISQFPPHYSDISQYDPTESGQHVNGATSEVSDQSHSASSGRGSAEDGEDVEDEEIRMINEGPLMQQQKLQRLGIHRDDDNMSDISVHNTQEYLARLGINSNQLEQRNCQEYSKMSSAHSVESMHMFDEEGGGEGDGMDISNLIYTKLNEVGAEENDAIMDGTRAFGFGDEGEPSMTGSLSSIVHSEEELTGSYNWDYLLDWGPQYQPLAHVFAEIARLKDDNIPLSYSSNPPKTLHPQVKTVPPPLITNVAPRSIAPIALSSGHTSQVTSFPTLPRSPIGHESTFSSPAMSPSFSPALSPLATRSPSISPLVSPGVCRPSAVQLAGSTTPHHTRPQRSSTHATAASSGSETELQI